MPRKSHIKKVLIIGSGPIQIGQAAEFDDLNRAIRMARWLNDNKLLMPRETELLLKPNIAAPRFSKEAAIAPGTQPARVNSSTIKTVPQPRSSTANGGKIMHRIALKTLIEGPCFW